MNLSVEITPLEIRRQLETGEKLAFIDVREAQEYAIGRIEGAELVPMSSVPRALQRLEELADEASLIVYCHHGVRSLSVVNWLREQGVERCRSMAGGIDRWSREVDPSIARY